MTEENGINGKHVNDNNSRCNSTKPEVSHEVLERIAEIQPELAGMLRRRVEEMDFATIRRVLNHE